MSSDVAGAPAAMEAEDHPLSFAQERILASVQLAGEVPVGNVPVAFRAEGDFSPGRFEAALGQVIGRHAILRTRFPRVGGRRVQRVASTETLDVPVIDVRADGGWSAAVAKASEFASHRFDLADDPPLEARIYRVERKRHLVVILTHQVLVDGWAVGELLEELSERYRSATGRDSRGERVGSSRRLHYHEYARRQRQSVDDADRERARRYWSDRLRDAPSEMELPYDRAAGGGPTYRGREVDWSLPEETARALEEFSRHEGVTPYVALLSALQALLARYGNNDDVLVATPMSRREGSELEGMIGNCANNLFLRVDVSGDPPFRELLHRVQRRVTEAYSHQELPLEQIGDRSPGADGVSPGPVPRPQVMFVFREEPPTRRLDLPGVETVPVSLHPGTAAADLTLDVARSENRYRGHLEYRTDRFNEDTVQRILGHLRRLTEGVVQDPETRLSSLPLLSAPERRDLGRWGGDTAPDRDRPLSAGSSLSQQLRRRGGAVALEHAGEGWSARQLAARVEWTTRKLRSLGVGSGDAVLLEASPSPGAAVGLLAVFDLGVDCLSTPVVGNDPAGGQEGSRRVDPRAVLLTARQPGKRGTLEETTRPTLDLSAVTTPLGGDRADAPESSRGPGGGPRTGRGAGGVLLPRRGTGRQGELVRLPGATARLRADGLGRLLELGEEDRLTQLAPPGSWEWVIEVVTAVLSGAVLVLPDRDVSDAPSAARDFLEEVEPTAVLVPRALPQLLVRSCDTIRTGVVRGKPGEAKGNVRWRDAPAVVRRTWGSLETGDFLALDSESGNPAREAGGARPLWPARVRILDRRGRQVPAGVEGEIHVGGPGVLDPGDGSGMSWHDRFRDDPLSGDSPDASLWRTGCAGRFTAGGQLVPRSRDEVDGAGGAGTEPARDLTATEADIARLWSEALGVETVRPSDTFYDLGGHSLAAAGVIAKIEDRFDVRLEPLEFAVQTLSQIARTCEDQGRTRDETGIEPTSTRAARRPERGSARAGMEPMFFPGPAGPLYGVLHRAEATGDGGSAALLCPPASLEYSATHRALRVLAERLSSAGVPCLRFDWRGTGDSSDADEGRPSVADWREDVESAARWLRGASGDRDVVAIGVRLGATVALLELPGAAALSGLVLWSPVLDGEDQLRPLQSFLDRVRGEQAGDVRDLALRPPRGLASLDLLGGSLPSSRPPDLLVLGDDAARDQKRFVERVREPDDAVRVAFAAPGDVDVWRQFSNTGERVPPETIDTIVTWVEGL